MSEDHDITLKDVSFAYGGEPVLENVNLNVVKGEFASIVGPNGGGKTTLLKVMLGLLKPDSGTVSVLGVSPARARLKVGYMPQYAHLDPRFPVTVMDVALMGRLGRRRFGGYSKNDRAAAMSALEEVNMGSLEGRMFNNLSGGQRQRVLIARALCGEPDLLLLDEPTANIDPEVEETLFETLKELNRRMTILLVSHDVGFVSRVVKSVICVNRRVYIHPTTRMNGKVINDIYGGDMSMVRHDHRCSEEGHSHD